MNSSVCDCVRIILFSGLLVSAPVFSKSDAKSEPFVVCAAASPGGLSPQYQGDGASVTQVAKTIYSRLVEIDSQTGQLVPSLATKWTLKNGGKTVRFELRKGVQWQSGFGFVPTRDFNSEDVLFSFDRQRLKDHPFHTVGGGNFTYFQSMGLSDNIESITAKGRYGIEFQLKRLDGTFLVNLTMAFASIYSAEYAEYLAKNEKKEHLDTDPIGTGPFQLVKFEKDQELRLSAHERYFGGAPRSKQLVFLSVPDPQVRIEKLKKSECHFVEDPDPRVETAVREDQALAWMSEEGGNLCFLNVNRDKPPLQDPRVRQAIFYALDRELYVKALFDGGAQVARSVLPPSSWAHVDVLPKSVFDPARSKALLLEAGLSEGFEIDLWYMSISRPYNPNGKQLAQLVQADLAKVGIRANLVTHDWGSYIKRLWKGEHMLAQSGWFSDNGDPDNFLRTPNNCAAKNSGARPIAWCDPHYDALTERARSQIQRSQRKPLYAEAQRLFLKELPWIPLFHSHFYRAMRKDVIGYVPSRYSIDRFDRVGLKAAQ